MKYLLTIISYARTGSNYLCGLLNESFKDINSNYELFNIKECFINENYKNLMINFYKNMNLNEKSRNEPIKFLKDLMNFSKENIISHKLFPEHLDIEKVYEIIDNSNLIILNKRNFKDVYISKKRAIDMMIKKYNNPWININTTNYKVYFDVEEFKRTEKEYETWFSNVLKYIINKKKKYFIINYDTFHTLTIQKQQELLVNKISVIYPLTINNYNIKLIDKQDKSNNYETKIENYDEFLNFFK